MAKINHGKTTVFNYVSAALMLVLLFLQFVPFWTYGETGETASISQYIWFPTDFGEVEKYIAASLGKDFSINQILGSAILILVLSAAGFVLCLAKADRPLAGLMPAACGLTGVIGYLTSPAMRLGTGWVLHLLVCAGMLAMGICTLREMAGQE